MNLIDRVLIRLFGIDRFCLPTWLRLGLRDRALTYRIMRRGSARRREALGMALRNPVHS